MAGTYLEAATWISDPTAQKRCKIGALIIANGLINDTGVGGNWARRVIRETTLLNLEGVAVQALRLPANFAKCDGTSPSLQDADILAGLQAFQSDLYALG